MPSQKIVTIDLIKSVKYLKTGEGKEQYKASNRPQQYSMAYSISYNVSNLTYAIAIAIAMNLDRTPFVVGRPWGYFQRKTIETYVRGRHYCYLSTVTDCTKTIRRYEMRDSRRRKMRGRVEAGMGCREIQVYRHKFRSKHVP